ncbi:hypothetical protein [Nocardioides antri]|uniref:Uncharacterized protein n=1 Tax=Nocardioides antri TaxID=2607659 RepID=A0A5B1M1G9_9ACTN|nr:hypothetical protein [Nocardioides antri]KAA1426601.1 hypothetical protein F0U47_14540 [Nocardioides antri]
MAIFEKGERAEHRFEHIGELQPVAGFDQLITVSVGPSGPVALWADSAARSDIEAQFERPGSASFPETRTSSRPQECRTAAWSLPARSSAAEALPTSSSARTGSPST